MALIYVALVIFLFAPHWNKKFNVGGYGMYDFFLEVEKVDEYNVDEGERLAYYPYGSRNVYKSISPSELQKNDVFAFIEKDESNKDFVHTQVFVRSEKSEGDTTLYYTHDLDNMTENIYTIASGRFLGKVTSNMAGVGKIVSALTTPSWLVIIVLVGFALVMIGIPLFVTMHQARLRKIGSPFPEGVDKTRLSTENLYIYLNIKEFLQSGNMVIKNGYDCDLVYAAGILFAVLHCTNGNIYLNINKDFTRHDDRIDRSGFICIPHVANLDAAKRRINSMYKAYFEAMVKRRIALARRRRRNQLAKRRQMQMMKGARSIR